MTVSDMARELVPDHPVYVPQAATRRGPCPHCTVSIEVGDAIVQRSFQAPWCHYSCALLEDELAADPQGFLERELEQSKRWRQGVQA